jgi:hypothetical protein
MRAFGIATMLLASVAFVSHASIIINTDQSASGSLGTVDLDDATGTTVTGITDGATVEFTGTESLVSGGGQARIDASDGSYTDLDITVPGFTFDRLVFRLFGPSSGQTVTIRATDDTGTVFEETLALTGIPSGDFFNVESDAVQQIASVSFTTSTGIESVRQVRVGGLEETGGAPPEIPEPSTMGLLGSGLVAVGLRSRLLKFLRS